MDETKLDRVLRRGEVEAITSLTERQLRDLEAQGLFPKRFVITPGGRAVGWSSNEVQGWLADRVEKREQLFKRGMAKPGQRVGDPAPEAA